MCLRRPEVNLDGSVEDERGNTVVLQGAERFMTSWHKGKEEASRDKPPSETRRPKVLRCGNQRDGRGGKRRGKRANEKRRTEWPDMCRIEFPSLISPHRCTIAPTPRRILACL